jgi:hydrogenase maturation protein HypF
MTGCGPNVAELRRRFLVGGIVQGVGFRPFVFNLAEAENLVGLVSNTSAGVLIEVQGPVAAVEAFARRLREDAPPLSRIVSVKSEDVPTLGGFTKFSIEKSRNTPGTNTLIPSDMATCADCLDDIRSPENRRFGYAFTNCTNCGPRWTIIDRIPYDRPFTSMASFEICADCLEEYEDPRDRRFHAQPNACPVCGPQVWLEAGEEKVGAEQALAEAARLLSEGKILAVKGLGGFHLAADACNEEAVQRLRKRKNREAKPLAVMISSLEEAGEFAHIGDDEAALLKTPEAPIVLVEKLPAGGKNQLAPAVAGGHRRLGVMLPYTPLHHLLFDRLAFHGVTALVMTSGNTSDEPICLSNDEARVKLGTIADAFLFHDRGIIRRADDSVLQILNEKPFFFRRSRGYAPVPVFIRGGGPDILAVGPELKNTICLLKNDRAFLSPHIGDLENLQAFEFFQETIATLQSVLECEPKIIAHDMHPGYFSTQWAQKQKAHGRTLVPVQHHHAHLVAVMAEHQVQDQAIGLIMDGTGYGTDETIWGGEILVGDAKSFTRLGHFEPMPLPGGDAAIKAPWRTAVSYLRQAVGDAEVLNLLPGSFSHLAVQPVLEIVRKGINSPLTTSCGRLFDAVAALIGPWTEVHYEAQAAIELMALTSHEEVRLAKPWAGIAIDDSLVLPVKPLVAAVAQAVSSGTAAAEISARFHRTLIDILVSAALLASRKTGLSSVVLAGGVFQNEILMSGLMAALQEHGLRPLTPEQTPANDGGIALGQALIAQAACGLPGS